MSYWYRSNEKTPLIYYVFIIFSIFFYESALVLCVLQTGDKCTETLRLKYVHEEGNGSARAMQQKYLYHWGQTIDAVLHISLYSPSYMLLSCHKTLSYLDFISMFRHWTVVLFSLLLHVWCFFNHANHFNCGPRVFSLLWSQCLFRLLSVFLLLKYSTFPSLNVCSLQLCLREFVQTL